MSSKNQKNAVVDTVSLSGVKAARVHFRGRQQELVDAVQGGIKTSDLLAKFGVADTTKGRQAVSNLLSQMRKALAKQGKELVRVEKVGGGRRTGESMDDYCDGLSL